MEDLTKKRKKKSFDAIIITHRTFRGFILDCRFSLFRVSSTPNNFEFRERN